MNNPWIERSTFSVNQHTHRNIKVGVAQYDTFASLTIDEGVSVFIQAKNRRESGAALIRAGLAVLQGANLEEGVYGIKDLPEIALCDLA